MQCFLTLFTISLWAVKLAPKMVSYSKGAALLASLVAPLSCYSYYVAPSSSKSSRISISGVFRPTFLHNTVLPRRLQYDPSTSATNSALSMGFMEEFITGRDDETRKAANEKYIEELQKRVERINDLEP